MLRDKRSLCPADWITREPWSLPSVLQPDVYVFVRGSAGEKRLATGFFQKIAAI